METKLTGEEIQEAIVSNYGLENDTFIPNISWGYFKTHEAVLLSISKAGYLTEFEIKRSYSDFLADFKKTTTHFEGKVMQLYYVVPESIKEKCWKHIEEYNFPEPYDKEHNFGRPPVGLLVYDENGIVWTKIDAPKLSHYTVSYEKEYKLFLEEINTLLRLGCMKLWQTKSLKLN